MSEGDTGWSRPTAGFFLRISLKKGILVLRCGRCPLCRWSVHLRRCRGTAIPLHCRILFSVFAGTRSGFGKFCFVFNKTSPFCPRPLRPYFARDMIGKRTRTSPFLLDFQGVSGFVLIITYGHTCASLLLSNGIPMKQIQIWLGHSTFSTTADIYAHLDFSAQEQSAAAMSGMFQRRETSDKQEKGAAAKNHHSPDGAAGGIRTHVQLPAN